jgi:PIN domain nuclease of toxin-antitoxin system
MKGLLDTHTFLWWDSEPSKLSAVALAFLKDPANTPLLSVVSVWEILIKKQLGKLPLNTPLTTMLVKQQANGIVVLAVALDHVLALDALPPLHKDPFDRLLIAQAHAEGAALLTADPIIARYAVHVLW